jgi:hypothetical protein
MRRLCTLRLEVPLSKKDRNVCVRLDEETYQALKRRAEQSRANDPDSNATVGHVARAAIQRHLGRSK